jgi:uncharacterized protein YecE (DUF72 family)
MERAECSDVSAPIRIGTSGWEYDGWRGDFYPADLPKDRWLEFYTRRFDTVELNASFYRLPPRWQPNPDRLSAFLDAARSDTPQAVEFRDRRWYEPATLQLVAASGMALCLHDMTGSATDHRPVGPFVYVRFHGAGAKYGGRYPDDVLEAWADRMVGWAGDGLPVWAYFNNDIGGHAPRDADRLRVAVARRT